MPNNRSKLHAVARLVSALHSPRFVDAGALYWASGDARFAAATLAGQRLWEVEVEDGARLVGVFDGHPVVLAGRVERQSALALVFLDPRSGAVVRRVAAPEGAWEVAQAEGVFGFLTASKRSGPVDRMVIVDAASGELRTIAEAGLATGLQAIAGGFLASLDHVVVAYDPKGRPMWQTDRLVAVSHGALLATELGGKLARLRPEDGSPMWSFEFAGAAAQSLLQVHADAEAIAVLEPALGELALLDRETGATRWRTRRVAARMHAPPLVTTDAVVVLAPVPARGGGAALAAFALADGSARGKLANHGGFGMTDGLVAGEVCVLGEVSGQALHLIRVPAKKAAAKKKKSADGAAGEQTSRKRAASKKTAAGARS